MMTFSTSKVNPENLAEYIDYVKNATDYDYNMQIADGLPLEDLFKSFDLLSDDGKYKLERLVINTYGERSSADIHNDDMLKEIMGLAKTYPDAFTEIYDKSGYGNDFSTLKIFRNINYLMGETDSKGRPVLSVSDRIYVANALDASEHQYPPMYAIGKDDDTIVDEFVFSEENLNQKEKEKLAKIKERYFAKKIRHQKQSGTIVQNVMPGDERRKCEITLELMDRFSAAYQAIISCTKKNGNLPSPHGAEANLAKDKVEKVLENYPDEVLTLATPEQKTPLFFGKKEEKGRINGLNKAINNFNRVLIASREAAGNSYIREFRGHILDAQSRETVEKRKQEAESQHIRENKNVSQTKSSKTSMVERLSKTRAKSKITKRVIPTLKGKNVAKIASGRS